MTVGGHAILNVLGASANRGPARSICWWPFRAETHRRGEDPPALLPGALPSWVGGRRETMRDTVEERRVREQEQMETLSVAYTFIQEVLCPRACTLKFREPRVGLGPQQVMVYGRLPFFPQDTSSFPKVLTRPECPCISHKDAAVREGGPGLTPPL